MATDISIPQAGESVTSGVISRWLKSDGDYVKRDEDVLELETDKVTMGVPAPVSGRLKISVKAGATVAIGQKVGEVDESAAAGASSGGAAKPSPAAAEAAPKAAASPAPKSEPKPEPKPDPAPVAARGAPATEARATPLARKLAEEHGVDVSRISGSGAGGRVREQDVLAFVQRAPEAPAPAPQQRNGAAHAQAASGVTRERMSPLRQRIAQRLVQAQHTAAMLTTFNECDMGAVMELRKTYKEEFEKRHGVGLGFMGFFVKAVCQALRAFPLVNASIVDDGGQPAVEKHESCDIAMAVSTPKGLVVPVLRGCQSLSLAEIELGIKDLAGKARDGKLTLEDMQGGTFTITNGGVFGSLMSTPILNPPQSGILGMHAIKNRAAEWPVGSGQLALRPMMYLALSYDHRIIDGAEAVQFLVKVKQAIEDPHRLLLNV